MAGVKGRSGGPRENAGGSRPGAGRKPVPPKKRRAKRYETQDPDDFLRAVMADPMADFKDRMAAALALKKTGNGGQPPGKKQQQADAAHGVVARSLAPAPPPCKPRLALVK